MADDGRIVIILPETDYFGSLTVARKLGGATEPLRKEGVSIIFSQATFPKDGKNYGELLTAARARAGEMARSFWHRFGFEDKLFWEIIGALLGEKRNGFDNATFDAGAGFELNEFFVDRINGMIVKEIKRSPHKKGILYFTAKRVSASLPFVKSLASAGTFATKVFLAGAREEGMGEVSNAKAEDIEDERLRETFLTLFLNEYSGYALACREGWGDTFSCFHSSDPYLVEGLINKFQKEYSLKEQLG